MLDSDPGHPELEDPGAGDEDPGLEEGEAAIEDPVLLNGLWISGRCCDLVSQLVALSLTACVWLYRLSRFAYIEFSDKESVRTSMALDESLFRGRQIKVGAKRTNRPGISTTDRGFPRARFRSRGTFSASRSRYYSGFTPPRGRGRAFRSVEQAFTKRDAHADTRTPRHAHTHFFILRHSQTPPPPH
ncbi:Polyadenylate-binding protein 2 [Acipenser ruthenus]|uniref:Polyadenylate-binding protein 2 n=1 Tax=Acipenser ruthenus TaxID=7906 RepID=A0A444V3Z0_ACIRT|nr:Polyadenylate-binding protein 2 [Acipenser ruthenus]